MQHQKMPKRRPTRGGGRLTSTKHQPSVAAAAAANTPFAFILVAFILVAFILVAFILVRENRAVGQRRDLHLTLQPSTDISPGLCVLPVYHKSSPLGLYATLTVSDLFFVFFVDFYSAF